MSYDTLLWEVADGIGAITLNRPDTLNAVNRQMTDELAAVLKAAAKDEAVRCLVVTGSGRGFSSGEDLKDHSGDEQGSLGDDLRRRYNPLILRLRTLEKPVIASVNGVAAGAGMSLAMACDLRIASDRARFIQSFSKVGLVPDSGSCFFLPRLVGLGKALELAWTADGVDAHEAERIGLVNKVVPPDRLAEETRTWAARLAAGPPKAYGLIKRAMNKALTASLEEMLEYEAYLQEATGYSEDFKEGVAAFVEKRPPVFTGR